MIPRLMVTFGLASLAGLGPVSAQDADKKLVVMIAGAPSHGPGEHEHNAGVLLLKSALEQGSADRITVKHHLNGEWPPADELARADAILIYSDGGGGHPALQDDRLAQLGEQMKRGCGFVCIHYAVEPTIPKGNKEFIDWMGGCFELNWSVNPHWDAAFESLPEHPVTRGVAGFGTNDEWYFHMRFRPEMKGIAPILSAVPPASTMDRPDGGHSGNPAARAAVAKKEPQHVAWAAERPDGGRGFGFTGGHFHRGWGNPQQRKLVCNAILWAAKAELPEGGVESSFTPEQLEANQDDKPRRRR